MADKLNIMYVFTDQHSALAMSCAGNPDLSTPNMDRLAASGVRFENTYCTQPLCSPNRASMFSGLAPRDAGVPWNNMEFDGKLAGRTLGHLVSAAGYTCAYGGKWHVPKGNIGPNHGFEELCGHDDIGLPDACAEFLKRKHEQPFFLVASFCDPHNICEWARNEALPWGPLPDAPPLAECPNLPMNFCIPPYEPELLRDTEQVRSPHAYPVRRFTPDDWRRYRWAYYRLVERVDARIGRILDTLDETGLTENTLVIFSSDHGDGHGAHQWNQKTILYEEIVRVPFIVSGPGVGSPGRTDTRLVSNGLDLMPTVLDYAGAGIPPDLPGLSVRPIVEGVEPAQWRDQVVVETMFGDMSIGSGRALRTGRYKYIAYSRGKNKEQLFDLQNDPGEMRNLAVEARYADVLDEHRRRLAAWSEQHDVGNWRRFRVPGHEYRPDGRRR